MNSNNSNSEILVVKIIQEKKIPSVDFSVQLNDPYKEHRGNSSLSVWVTFALYTLLKEKQEIS